MTNEELLLRIENYIRRSDESMKSVEVNIQAQLYGDALSRLYYSAYQLVRASLELKGISTKTHRGTLTKFSEHFIKVGIFESGVGKAIYQAQDMRNSADYEAMHSYTNEEVEAILPAVSSAREDILEWLNNAKEELS